MRNAVIRKKAIAEDLLIRRLIHWRPRLILPAYSGPIPTDGGRLWAS